MLVVVMLFTMSNFNVFAAEAEPMPTTLDAPSVILYDYGAYNTNLAVKVRAPESVMDVYEKGSTNLVYDEEDYTYTSDYGDVYLHETAYQIDWKIDEGEWQYTSEWDEDYYAGSSYAYGYFDGERVAETGIGSASSWYMSGIAAQLNEAGCLSETTDGSSTYYRLDTDNHKVSVRVRYFFTFVDNDYNYFTVLSDWSNVAVYGQGNATTSIALTSLSAPVIANLEEYEFDSYCGYPQCWFDIYPSEDIVDALMWSEGYDQDLEYSEVYLEVETSLDPNFGEGSVINKHIFGEYSILERKLRYEDLYYDLWWELPTSDHEAFSWNGETVYLRTKWVNEREVDGAWSEIESPYSNVLSITGPVIGTYDVNITHGSYGFDNEGYYSESYKITEGCEYEYIYTAPLEGCYVDTITINGVLMFDYEDESTYENLDTWPPYHSFSLHDDENYANRDLDIEIVYAGTPTAMYGITTENTNGGYLYTDDRYVSWEDNSLVVYHGTAPTIEIYPYDGFVIEEVLIDGVANEEAKANGYYTFEPITDDSHSIEVSFKREAYLVTYWADSNGTISSDYDWYNDDYGYVRIGDDVTFTFAPNDDGHGNYYEIERVYIDSVLDEAAKNAGTYTFENVQANHSIDVYFSDDPVITHDVTATSGENGSISPEGVVHVREGGTKQFLFYPDDGYEVDKVYIDGTEITNLATKEYYNIANVTEDRTIHVTFKKLPVYYDVNVVVNGHNPSVQTVNPRGTTPVLEGEPFTVTFSPFTGYEVEKVLVNGLVIPANETYTISAVSMDTTIEIFFKIKSYTVTFVDYNGSILKTETVDYGNQATPPDNPTREHYVFSGWDTDYSNVTTNVTVRATYRPADYTVKFIGWNGAVLKTETVIYQNDATAPTPPEREGYVFDRWSHDFTNVSSNLDVTAIYIQKEYTVTFVDSDDSVLKTETVKHGNAATPPANPTKEGYTFVGWDNMGYGNVTQDMTVKAMYVDTPVPTYTVTARALGNTGTVSLSGATTVQENGSLTLNFAPDELSKIIRVVVDGVDIDICDSYTFENITANHTVDVYFAPTAVINVETNDVAQGTVNGSYELIGDSMAYVLDVTAAEGYELEGIYINGVKTELEVIGGEYVIRDLSADMNVEVRFKAVESGGDEPGDQPVVPGPGDEPDDQPGDEPIAPDLDENDDVQKPSEDNNDKNDTNDTPETGDKTSYALWLGLMTVSAAAMLVARKRKTE